MAGCAPVGAILALLLMEMEIERTRTSYVAI